MKAPFKHIERVHFFMLQNNIIPLHEELTIEKIAELQAQGMQPADLLALLQEVAPAQTFTFPKLNDKGKPYKIIQNLAYLLDYYNIKVKYNEMSREVDVKGTKYDSLNHSITHIYSLAHEHDFKLAKSDVVDFVDILGIEGRYNPVLNYLNTAKIGWDGNSRIHQLCDTLITDDSKIDATLKFELIRTWLVSSARITTNSLKNPINAEGLLVLQGAQGIGKTTWIKKLIPESLIDYFKEGVQLDVNNKDSVYEATCNWICELGELDGTLKREQASLKAFFTKSIDVQRRPYAVKEEKYPRLTSFFGTVNDAEFLQDSTGDRRYWVIPIEEINFKELQKIDLDQLWGEAMYIAMSEPKAHFLNQTIMQMLNESNADFRVTSNVQLKVQSHFDWNAPQDEWALISTSDIANRLDLKTSKGLKQAIIECGGVYKRTNSIRGYVVPPFKSVYNV